MTAKLHFHEVGKIRRIEVIKGSKKRRSKSSLDLDLDCVDHDGQRSKDTNESLIIAEKLRLTQKY